MNIDPLPELRPHPALPMWSVRWLLIGPLCGWAIGASGGFLRFGGWWFLVALVVVVAAAVALVWWGRWMMRANLVAVAQHHLCHRTYGPVHELGATVTIQPGATGMGEVIVDLPPKGETNGH